MCTHRVRPLKSGGVTSSRLAAVLSQGGMREIFPCQCKQRAILLASDPHSQNEMLTWPPQPRPQTPPTEILEPSLIQW